MPGVLNDRRTLLTTDAVGGVWRYSLELARGFAARDVAVTLAVLGPAPDREQLADAASIPGIKVATTGLPLDWTAKTPAALDISAATLAELAWRTQADTVQLHSPALMGSAIWPVPVIAAAHSCVATWWHAVRSGPLPADLAWRAEAMARGLVAADAVIAPSASFAKALRDCYGLRRHVTAIPNGLAPLCGRAERTAAALTVGRLWDEGKGIATLDAAAAQLSHPVYAAGPVEGPNGATITTSNVTLCGTLYGSALANAYAAASVFVSIGRYEPFGLAVLEAAQSGCALVLADIPTFRELWDGVAVFVQPDSPTRLADALAALLDDPPACARLGESARDRALRFDPARMAAATWHLHETTLMREAA